MQRKIINFFKLKLKKNSAVLGEKVFIIFVFLSLPPVVADRDSGRSVSQLATLQSPRDQFAQEVLMFLLSKELLRRVCEQLFA